MAILQKLALTVGIMSATYVIGSAIIFRQIEAIDYWEVIGYLNGLMRGSGNYATAIANLNNWRNYWLARAWWKGLVNHFYNHGLQRIHILYGR